MSDRITMLEQRVEELERKLGSVMAKLELSEEEPDIKRNDTGDYSIKVVYPGIYHYVDEPAVGFPRNRQKLAQRVRAGSKMFIYVTSPVKQIVGMAEVKGPAHPGKNPQWPFEVGLKWEIGPKVGGVRFDEVGIDIRPRVGDTLYKVTPAKAEEIIDALNKLPDLSPDQLKLLQQMYAHIK